MARAILDSGSQRTYITSRLRDELNLPIYCEDEIAADQEGEREGEREEGGERGKAKGGQ